MAASPLHDEMSNLEEEECQESGKIRFRLLQQERNHIQFLLFLRNLFFWQKM